MIILKVLPLTMRTLPMLRPQLLERQTAFSFVCNHRALHVGLRSLADRRFAKSHEWISIDGVVGTVGVSAHAADALGDVVHVELPEPDTEVEVGGDIAVVESVKAASDIYSPMTGSVTENNGAVADNPAMINKSPMGDGWLYKLKLADQSEAENLMTQTQYDDFLKGLKDE